VAVYEKINPFTAFAFEKTTECTEKTENCKILNNKQPWIATKFFQNFSQ
jgi:hypothetical protein